MRIACLADLHGNLPDVESCDLVILAGDLCPFGNWLVQLAWLNSSFRYWLDKLQRRGIGVVGIAGNHDSIFEDEPAMIPILPWVYLQDDEVQPDWTTHQRTIGHHIARQIDYDNVRKLGLRIWGTPWSLTYGSWSFMGDENYLKPRFEAIPEGIDIIIAHGPPQGYGDLCPPKITADNEHLWPSWVHEGSYGLLEAIDRIKPRLVVFGHVHQGRGTYERGDTILCNAGIWDHTNDSVRDPIYINLD